MTQNINVSCSLLKKKNETTTSTKQIFKPKPEDLSDKNDIGIILRKQVGII